MFTTRKMLIAFLLLFSISIFSQDYNALAKEDLKTLFEKFQKVNQEYIDEKKVFDEIKNSLTEFLKDETISKLNEQKEKIKLLRESLNSICNLKNNYEGFYTVKGVKTEDLKLYFPEKCIQKEEEGHEVSEPITYLYFGDNRIIKETTLFQKETENKIFRDILSEKSESYLGDFIIPQKGQLINSRKKPSHIKNDSSKNNNVKKKDIKIENIQTKTKSFKFKSIKIELLEGSLNDVKLIVFDDKKNELLFENRIPISLLSYTKASPKNYLSFSTISSNNKNKKINWSDYENYEIRLSDVLTYIPNPGENYVPDDLNLEFPTIKDGVEENLNQSVKYKVIQDTSLKNVLELRTYTDFLALFGESANGIVQLEANADFFIIPFNLKNTSIYFMKKVTPFVSFSRLDENDRYVNISEKEDGTNYINHSLSVIEKSYLDMGLKFDLLSFKLMKEYPFNINIYLPLNYLITDIKKDNLNEKNIYKTFGYGSGIRLEFKKFNNFGFNYSAEITKNESNHFNAIENFENLKDFWVFRNEAEIYFFPGNSKNQSIFLRFRAFNNSSKNNTEAFYQLQFGYKFSLGINKLKK